MKIYLLGLSLLLCSPPAFALNGDCNNDGLINISDAICVINLILKPDPCNCANCPGQCEEFPGITQDGVTIHCDAATCNRSPSQYLFCINKLNSEGACFTVQP